jgi:hypothetical protein
VKLEKSGGIDLAKLALGRPKLPLESDCWRFCRKNRGTAAEELVFSINLSMYLDSYLESDDSIID